MIKQHDRSTYTPPEHSIVTSTNTVTHSYSPPLSRLLAPPLPPLLFRGGRGREGEQRRQSTKDLTYAQPSTQRRYNDEGTPPWMGAPTPPCLGGCPTTPPLRVLRADHHPGQSLGSRPRRQQPEPVPWPSLCSLQPVTIQAITPAPLWQAHAHASRATRTRPTATDQRPGPGPDNPATSMDNAELIITLIFPDHDSSLGGDRKSVV